MFYQGFKFGMALQFAVGPVSIYVFQAAITKGFLSAMSGMVAVVLVDGFYILLAALGVGAIIRSSYRAANFLKIFGSVVLIFFGLIFILGAFNISLFGGIDFAGAYGGNTFINTALLTLSSPLTIIFWAGVFSARVAESNLKGNHIRIFAAGCIFSTVVFFTFLSGLGALATNSISDSAIKVLNGGVGLLLFYFGLKGFLKKS